MKALTILALILSLFAIYLAELNHRDHVANVELWKSFREMYFEMHKMPGEKR